MSFLTRGSWHSAADGVLVEPLAGSAGEAVGGAEVDVQEGDSTAVAEVKASVGPFRAVIVGCGQRGHVTIYEIQVTGRDGSHSVHRRFRHFEALVRATDVMPPASGPLVLELPPKSFFRKTLRASFMADRMRLLGELLDSAMSADPYVTWVPLQFFLGFSGSVEDLLVLVAQPGAGVDDCTSTFCLDAPQSPANDHQVHPFTVASRLAAAKFQIADREDGWLEVVRDEDETEDECDILPSCPTFPAAMLGRGALTVALLLTLFTWLVADTESVHRLGAAQSHAAVYSPGVAKMQQLVTLYEAAVDGLGGEAATRESVATWAAADIVSSTLSTSPSPATTSWVPAAAQRGGGGADAGTGDAGEGAAANSSWAAYGEAAAREEAAADVPSSASGSVRPLSVPSVSPVPFAVRTTSQARVPNTKCDGTMPFSQQVDGYCLSMVLCAFYVFIICFGILMSGSSICSSSSSSMGSPAADDQVSEPAAEARSVDSPIAAEADVGGHKDEDASDEGIGEDALPRSSAMPTIQQQCFYGASAAITGAAHELDECLGGELPAPSPEAVEVSSESESIGGAKFAQEEPVPDDLDAVAEAMPCQAPITEMVGNHSGGCFRFRGSMFRRA